MNERIKLLAEQAGMTDDKFGMYFAKDKHNEDGVDLEKFAELIVGECMEVASPNYMSTPEDSVYYVEQAINRIAEHFGVEEK